MNFKDLQITREFINAIEDLGFDQPTDIQIKAIPQIRAGQEVIGIAQTGTGKTAAYLLPILQFIKYPQGNDPRCLILVPTKELVLQVLRNAQDLSKYTEIRTIGLYGGVGPKKQIEELSEGVDIIVSTPGRFMELYSKNEIKTKQIKHIVMDEADRMMDMGFMHQIKKIQEVLPTKRQNLLFSATFPEKVERLSEEFLLWPKKIEITPQATPVETVEQELYRVPNFMTKLNLLLHFLTAFEDEFQRVLIFVGTKQLAKNISRFLERKNVGEIRTIHSDKGQNSRINAMDDFKKGDIRILVSTDVSARGIDVPDVSHVINFTVPQTYEDYVHRIGRTGRAFKTGKAVSFMDVTEKYHVKKIEDLIRQLIPIKELPEDVFIEETDKKEKQEQARTLDWQKRREDPTFKGAFHKRKPKSEKKKKKKR